MVLSGWRILNSVLAEQLPMPEQALAAQCNLCILQALSEQILRIEKAVRVRVNSRPEIKF